MAKGQGLVHMSRGFGPPASRRGSLRAGLAIGTLALGQRVALGQSGGAHVHMPELGIAKVPVTPAMDQPLVEPDVRRTACSARTCAAPSPIATSAACVSISGPTRATWRLPCA
jgi:hypothetical protein